jgi:hypothetical protein
VLAAKGEIDGSAFSVQCAKRAKAPWATRLWLILESVLNSPILTSAPVKPWEWTNRRRRTLRSAATPLIERSRAGETLELSCRVFTLKRVSLIMLHEQLAF